ncbi:MAG: peptide chain release factor N(5)-glutamine methyltransferase [Patescibacteria group bacterium]|jgi:release factor glutamine methyltransferase
MNIYEINKKIARSLKEAGIESGELDASVIIAHVLGQDKTFILSHPEFELGETQKEKIQDLANKRSKSVPIAYLTGHKEFFGYDFLVDERVLIPRPETEFLVEQALEFIKSKFHKVESQLNVLDVGTGSGCIIISLVESLPTQNSPLPTFCATDISEKALIVARKNAKLHVVGDKINFFRSDLFANPRLPKMYDLIIANLPYVPREVESQKSKVKSIDFEPQDAIFADENGTEIINRFLAQASSKLNQNGLILIELDPRNAIEIKKTAERYFPTAKIDLTKDLAGLQRYVSIRI